MEIPAKALPDRGSEPSRNGGTTKFEDQRVFKREFLNFFWQREINPFLTAYWLDEGSSSEPAAPASEPIGEENMGRRLPDYIHER